MNTFKITIVKHFIKLGNPNISISNYLIDKQRTVPDKLFSHVLISFFFFFKAKEAALQYMHTQELTRTSYTTGKMVNHTLKLQTFTVIICVLL